MEAGAKWMGQEERDKANKDNARNLAEKWVWDKGLYGCEEGTFFF